MNMPKLPTENMFVPSVVEEFDPILQTINAANDSAWVIEEELKREYFRKESLDILKANVGHLKIVLSDENITNSNYDLTRIKNAIDRGTEALILLGDLSFYSLELVDEFVNKILDEQSK